MEGTNLDLSVHRRVLYLLSLWTSHFFSRINQRELCHLRWIEIRSIHPRSFSVARQFYWLPEVKEQFQAQWRTAITRTPSISNLDDSFLTGVRFITPVLIHYTDIMNPHRCFCRCYIPQTRSDTKLKSSKFRVGLTLVPVNIINLHNEWETMFFVCKCY